MQDWIHERASAAGFDRYEVSGYAQPQRQCKHNLNYWRFGDYLGIGAGAHGKLSFPERIIRQSRFKHPATYMERCRAGNPIEDEHEVGPRELPFEFMLNALRLTEGFPVHRYTERTGLTMASIDAPLREAEARGLLTRDHENIVPTALGLRFLNDLQGFFLKD